MAAKSGLQSDHVKKEVPRMTTALSIRRPSSLGARLSIGAFLLVASMLTFLVGATSYSISNLIERNAGDEMTDKTKLLVTLIEASDKELQARTQFLAKSFQASLKGKIEIDPATVDIKGRPTPTLKIDGQSANLDFTAVDAFTQSTGALATLFVRSGDDFVRVTTSLKDDHGERVVGTVLDRTQPSYKAAMAGTDYLGLATLFGHQYMTHYEALRDPSGQVAAIAFVGLDFSEHLGHVKAAIRSAKIGQTGYFYVLDATPGQHFGDLLVHPTKEGKNILDSKDPAGHAFIQEILERKDGLISYPWINATLGDAHPRDKLVAFAYYKNWNWEIAGGTYVDEYTDGVHRLLWGYAAICAMVVVLMSGGLFLLIRALVTRPLKAATLAAEAIAHGDLTVELKTQRRDEVGDLIRSMNSIGAGLTQVVRSVRENSENVATACTQIAQGNQDLSTRTEQQASALQVTASSMEQLGATVKQNAAGAIQANELALGASAIAAKGGDIVAEVVGTMKGINESSRKIADIIGVIDGIAFQTNILALNAAVEAARAGESGRGFAVVATEVRSLAGRSAEAAREIKRLIGVSVERVEQGSLLVDRAGSTMTEVVTSIRRVTDIMGEISAASAEQSIGVAQVGTAVGLMDASTQQNAALVEEMAAAATSLSTQADGLVQSVTAFKLMGE